MNRGSALKALVLVLLVAGAAMVLRTTRRVPPDVQLRGQRTRLGHPNGALSLDAPAFLGLGRPLSSPTQFGLAFGDFGTQGLVVTVTPAETKPFEGAGLPPALVDGYMGCMLLALPGEKSSWWERVAQAKTTDAEPPLAWVAGINRIPLVSRACLVATNDTAPLNVRIYGTMLRETWERFRPDLEAMLQSVHIDDAKARAAVGVPAAAP